MFVFRFIPLFIHVCMYVGIYIQMYKHVYAYMYICLYVFQSHLTDQLNYFSFQPVLHNWYSTCHGACKRSLAANKKE